jgi:hypothetical protein
MGQQGSYPIGGRTLAGGDTLTGVVTGATADVPLTKLGAFLGTTVPYTALGTGAVAMTTQSKLQQYVSVRDFGAVGDGVTDDTVALTNFWNSAISRPGVPHRLDANTYAVSAILPTISVNNVQIIGEGADIHDVGTLMTGTVLKWIGTGGTVGPLITVTANSGASNQRVSNVMLAGIGINCNNGAINYGARLVSVRDSLIDLTIANAGVTGLDLNVVAALGESKDVQRNKIYLKARQVETSALALSANGDAIGNVSMNEFWVDVQCKNSQAIYLINTDNNDWRFVRTYLASGGTATEGVSCLGGTSAGVACRNERFWFFTGNLPIHVYGTSGSPSFASPSVDHAIYFLDSTNSTPAPTVETGGAIHVHRGSDQLAGDPWVPYTPTLSVTSGALTTASASGEYLRRGKILYFKVQISVTTNGTGAGQLGFTVPFASVGTIGQTTAGKERASTGKGVLGFLDAAASVCNLQFYDGTYPGANGYVINVSGFYEVA